MAKTYKVSTVEVSAQSRKEWLARKRGKGEVATSAAAVVVQSEASSAPSALDALFRQVNIGSDDAPKYVAEALFPLRIGDALLDWHADQKYLGVEHATESEKANFFATGGVTAGGIGSSSGGSGGGGSSTLAGLNDVALKSAIANDMLVYNGTHWVNTPMSAIKPDLTAYATTAEVANTYATKTALQGVDIRVQAIEYIFEEDQDGVINKWSEIVDFLAGVEGTTLDSILQQFVTIDSLPSYTIRASSSAKGKVYLQENGHDISACTILLPAKLSEFADDVVAGNYLPLRLSYKTYIQVNAEFGVYDPFRNYVPLYFRHKDIDLSAAIVYMGKGYGWAVTNAGWTESHKFLLHEGNYTDYTYSKSQVDTALSNKLDKTDSSVALQCSANIGTNFEAITPEEIYALYPAEGAVIKKGVYHNAGNGVVNTNITEAPSFGLAGTTLIQAGSYGGYFTQLYLTPDVMLDNKSRNEILMYSYIGGKTAWTRVLTNRNYTDYTVPKTGGKFNGRLYVQTSDSNGFANEMSGKGSYLIHVPNVASTDSWSRGLALYDDATSTSRELIGSYGTSEGNKYDYLGGTFNNHILQLRLSDKFSTFHGDVKTYGKFIGNLQGNADSASSIGNYIKLYEFEKKNNSGNPCVILICEYTNSYGASSNAPQYGFVGQFLATRDTGYTAECMGYISARMGYADTPGAWGDFYTTSDHIVPVSVKYNNKYYIGLRISNSDRKIKLIGRLYNGLDSFIQLHYINSSTPPEGVEILRTGSYNNKFIAEHATKLQTARTLWGQSFDGTGDVGGDLVFDKGVSDRHFKITTNGKMDFCSPSSGGYATAYRILTNDEKTDLGSVCGAYGSTANSLRYFYYGGNYDAPYMAITNSGNVGIGTTSPTSKLHVAGGARITDNTTIEQNLWVDKNIYLAESESNGAIYFGDDEYAYIKETPDDVMTIASNQGLILKVNHISDEGAVIKLDGPVRIGDAILSWDSTNKCVTIKNANTGEKASLFVDGGVTATAIN